MRDRKKIMHIVQSPGGVERYILMLLKNMDTDKYENIIVCSYDYNKEDFNNLVNFFEHVDMIRNINIIKDFLSIIKIRKLIKKYKPDIVYMHSSKAGALGRIANFGIKNISIYNPHGWAFNMESSKNKKNFYCIIERILARLCNCIIAISKYEKDCAIKNKICDEKKIRVIFNGTDIKEYEKKKRFYSITREKLNIPKESYVIGTVCRLTPGKAPDTFIEMASKIKKEIENAFFILVGDGEMRQEIEKKIKEKGLSNCAIITGWIKEPMEYINLFDQAMLLSKWEGFGLVLAEYMLAAKPIIATKVGAIPNLIQNKVNGVLCNVDDVDEMVKGVKHIFDNKEFKQKLIENSSKKVNKDFSIERVVKEHDTLICDLLKRSNIY